MNGSHIRRISIVMRALEDATVEIEDACEIHGRRTRLLTAFEDDIADSVKPIILGKLRQIKSEIQDRRPTTIWSRFRSPAGPIFQRSL